MKTYWLFPVVVLFVHTYDSFGKDTKKLPLVFPVENLTVITGRDATLTCKIENLGKYKIAWVHMDRKMVLSVNNLMVTRIPRFSVKNDRRRQWDLHIEKVEQDDRGNYMCQVNTEPMMKQSGFLTVVIPPEIQDEATSPSQVAIPEGTDAMLTCTASGYPKPTITWKREDGNPLTPNRRRKVNSTEGENLHLSQVSRSHMGAYLCIANNGVPPSVSKRIVLNIEFPPKVWVENQLVGAPKNKSVSLECAAEGYPKTIHYWLFKGNMILSGQKYETKDTSWRYKTRLRLTIKNVNKEDFGIYKCVVKNSLGSSDASIKIFEIASPSLSPRATGVRMRGNKTLLPDDFLSVSSNNSAAPTIIFLSLLISLL